jgi:branched-chain amino acid transport system permease protein
MPDMTQLGQIVVGGLTNGAIYALIALGFSLVFAVNGYLNLLQGEYVVLGGLIAIGLSQAFEINLAVTITASVAITTAFAVLVQVLTLSPRRKLSPDAALIITLGAAFVARGLAMVVFGKDALSLQSFSGERPVTVGDVAISTQSIWILGTLVLASGLLWWFFSRTFIGKAMLACAQSPTGARLVGINLAHVSVVAFATSAALGALAGVVAAPMTFMTYDEGLGFGIKGFIAAVFGMLGSYPGAVVGGLALGLMEAATAGYISSQFKDALAFCAVLLLLLLRPGGLTGARP